MRPSARATALLMAAFLLPASCGDGHDPAAAGSGTEEHAGEHAHTAPRGGTLVVLAEEFAHVEVLRDAAAGELRLFLLGPHATQPVRSAEAAITVSITVNVSVTVNVTPTEGPATETFDVVCSAVGSALTGETPGDTSEFLGVDERLRGTEPISATIRNVTARGRAFRDVAIEALR